MQDRGRMGSHVDLKTLNPQLGGQMWQFHQNYMEKTDIVVHPHNCVYTQHMYIYIYTHNSYIIVSYIYIYIYFYICLSSPLIWEVGFINDHNHGCNLSRDITPTMMAKPGCKTLATCLDVSWHRWSAGLIFTCATLWSFNIAMNNVTRIDDLWWCTYWKGFSTATSNDHRANHQGFRQMRIERPNWSSQL